MLLPFPRPSNDYGNVILIPNSSDLGHFYVISQGDKANKRLWYFFLKTDDFCFLYAKSRDFANRKR